MTWYNNDVMPIYKSDIIYFIAYGGLPNQSRYTLILLHNHPENIHFIHKPAYIADNGCQKSCNFAFFSIMPCTDLSVFAFLCSII